MSGKHPTVGARLDVSFRTDLTVERLAPLWIALEASARPSFFLSWQWVGCWLRETGLTPNLLMAHASGTLVGLALLQPGNEVTFPRIPSRYLTASGNASFDSVFIEYNGFLVAPSEGERVGGAFRDFLARFPSGQAPVGRWSKLHFPGTNNEMLSLWMDRGFAVKIESSRPAPFIEFEDLRRRSIGYLESRSRNCRQQIRRSMRLFQDLGPLELDVASTLEEAHSIFEEMKSLHQISWRAKGKPGAFAIPFFEQFHRTLLTEAWPAGRIDLVRLRAGSETIGCLYNFLHDGNAYAYQSGFAYGSNPRCKPGLVAHAMAAERYLSAGFNRYLFLAGESRYKTSLATGADRLHWLVVRRKGFRAAAEELAEQVGKFFFGRLKNS